MSTRGFRSGATAVALVGLTVALAALVRHGFQRKPAEPATEARLDPGQAAQRTRELVNRTIPAGSTVLTAEGIDALTKAVRACVDTGQPDRHTDCVPFARSLLEAEEARVGREAPDLAGPLTQLSTLLVPEGQVDEARALLLRLKAIRERRFGAESAEVALSFNQLGNFTLEHDGDRSRAFELLAEALRIRRAVFGEDHLLVGYSLHNLANVQKALGAYGDALASEEAALKLIARHRGPDHPDVAIPTDHLGVIHMSRGDYASARTYLESAMAIRSKHLAPTAFGIAISANNLGELLALLGDYRLALPLFERAFTISLETFGDRNHQTGVIAENLARAYADLGDHPRATATFLRALSIYRSVRRQDSREEARALIGLAHVEAAAGRTRQARRALDAALPMAGRAQVQPGVRAQAALGLAQLDILDGRTAAAEPLIRTAVDIAGTLGDRHPLLAEGLAMDGWRRLAAGDTAGAIESALDAERISRENLRSTVRELGERQALRYAGTRLRGLDPALTAIVSGHVGTVDVRRVWESVIASRTLVLDEMASRTRAPVDSGDPEIAHATSALSAARRRLAFLKIRSLDAPGSLPAGALESARADVEALERVLARGRVGPPAEGASTSVWSDLEAALPSATALVAIVRHSLNPGPGAAKHYLAFVRPARGGAPLAVPLGTAAQVESAARDWRESIERLDQGVPAIWSPSYRGSASTLRDLIWTPLAGAVQGADRVFLVPDGVLHTVNYAALPAGDTTYLVEDGPTFHYLSAERDLLRPASVAPGPRSLLALGGPDFQGSPNQPLASPAPAGAFRGAAPACDWHRESAFVPLPKAAQEAADVARRFAATDSTGRVLSLTGGAASETAFKAMAHEFTMLHLATHAFLIRDDCAWDASHPFLTSLSLTGLALAGANRRVAQDVSAEDGLLTAEEIAALDLSRVRWVVLSACETAAGRLQDGEGVLGLRRAFEVAGAGTVIMSLWQIRDTEAARWMAAFYDHALSGADPATAVRRASLDRLRAARSAGARGPAAWAAFVSAGDWR